MLHKNAFGLDKKYSDYRNSKVVILPIPFDFTSSWGKGADKGPEAIIDASGQVELYDIETRTEPYVNGIFTADPIKKKTSETMIKAGYESVKKFLADGKFIVTLGGEHSISQGPIQAYAEKFNNLSVLHLDAHSDRRDNYEKNKFSHACVMARAEEIVKNVVSVGVRSLDSSELPKLKKGKIFFAENLMDSDAWMDKAVNELSEQVYVTIDLDVFDPSIIPSTGTPEPGGMEWYQILKLLKLASAKKEIVGCDVVELAPDKHEKSSDFAAAKLIYKILSYKFGKK